MRKQTTKNVSQGTHTHTHTHMHKPRHPKRGEIYAKKWNRGKNSRGRYCDSRQFSSVQLTFTWLRIVEFVLMMTT